MAQYLLTTPGVRYVVDYQVDEKGKFLLDDNGQRVAVVKEIVSPWFGYDLALQSVTTGPKLFEVWALRKRIKEVFFKDRPQESARYMILSEEEKDILVTGFKTLDWTFGHKHVFWVEWEQLFDSVSTIPVFNEKAPPADYVTWKQIWEKQAADREAAQREAELKALAEKEAAEAKRNSGIKRLADERLQTALEAKIAEGKLGNAAGIDDLPSALIGDIRAQASVDYDANPAMFDAPLAPDVVEVTAEPVTAVLAPEQNVPENVDAAPEAAVADIVEAQVEG